APGVKVGKILSLENDIALGLKAMAVRIQAPVPGKGTVGIEVPNKRAESVFLRDIIESEDWAKSKAEIPIALGKEVSGRPLIADLTKMPHLLVAGATGSGKTVCINTIIASLLYHSSPDDVRFIMVDPKIVEMQVFNDLPHMLIPVVTDPKKVPGALKWLINEMERRYQVFAEVGVRNISGFNEKQRKKRLEEEERSAQAALEEMSEEDILGLDKIPDAEAPAIEVPRDTDIEIPEKYPYIVCIIDELADLMMVAAQDVEAGIVRLAQLARAAGIHLIIATQRPSVNVITGLIKANLPCRIAFRVSSKVDSRTILDANGADQLIGRGDMLFNLPDGSGKLIRSQGCFVSDDEINNIVDFLKQNGEPQYVEEVQQQLESDEGDDVTELGEEEDDLFPQALEVIRTTGRASTSMLQRRLKIGYNRAARIMDLMEARGIVGPDNGSKPRDILMDLESL
ncbi:MAG: DNA translocase FtsK, partial [Verrucomicrobiae bacterium]|nr:DNA translocase FtsK [Verrucomicrobiae bacterium]